MKPLRPIHSLFVFLLCLFAASAQAERGTQWTVVDLGSLGPFQGGQALGVNNRGDAVGGVFVARPAGGCCVLHPFLWQNGTMTDITPAGTTQGQAVAINENGTALLQMDGPQIYLSRDGTATKLPFFGVARDINNDDAVVGGAQIGFFSHAFIYHDGVLQDLGAFGGTHSEAFAVNNAGIVVGNARMPDNAHDYAFVFMDGILRNIDTVRGFDSAAFDVNDNGVVVGAFTDNAMQTFAFVWDQAGGMRKLLDIPGSIAVSINNRGDVVGSIGATGSFLLSDGVLTRLETLPAVQAAGFSRLGVHGINERGWIVATAFGNGNVREILLVPHG